MYNDAFTSTHTQKNLFLEVIVYIQNLDIFVFIYLIHVMFYAVLFYFCITFTACLVHKHLKKISFCLVDFFFF